jgi:opacity protein-like surface antigen
MKLSVAMTFLLIFVASARAGAQTLVSERVFISVNGLYQMTSNEFDDTTTINVNAENGRFDTDYDVGGGLALDVSGAVVVWRNLAVGAGVTLFSTSTPTTIEAQVPHPFFFNQPRSVSGELEGDRRELAVHVQAKWIAPLSTRLLVTVFGGPSFFQVEQTIVTDFDYDESYPFDTATFSRAIADTESESKMGFNVGGDVAYFFSNHVGVGGTLQYSGATVEMTVPSGTTDVKAGGLQIGGGLRLRF